MISLSLRSLLSKPKAERDTEWIAGALLCTWAAAVILVINIILTIIAAGFGYSRRDGGGKFDSVELYAGSCTVTTGWTNGLHIVINVLSTILLALSNYTMQCLAAPSRADIDHAHYRRRWLDIGTFSFRNFFVMDTRRKVLWMLLLLSSTPIHMIYNSVIFSSIVTFDYGILYIPDDLAPTESLIRNETEAAAFQLVMGVEPAVVQAQIFNGTFQNLTNKQCYDAYNTEFISTRGNLLFVADRKYFHNVSSLVAKISDQVAANQSTPIQNDSIAELYYYYSMGTDVINWYIYISDISIPISYCLSEKVDGKCQLFFSPAIVLCVIICNAIKVACMYLTAKTSRKQILFTVGDGIASFLTHPDETTKGRCLLSRADLTNSLSSKKYTRISASDGLALGDLNQPFQTHPMLLSRPKRWFQAVSKTRWAVVMSFFLACLGVSIFLFVISMANASGGEGFISLAAAWEMGFGQPSSTAMIGSSFVSTNLIALVLISNTPQLVLSILYFLCNSLLTAMLVAAEFDSYAIRRKPLRVSWPQGLQRSTYYLSLPFRYSVPLLIVSAVMHWLLSQSIFFVDIVEYEDPSLSASSSITRGACYSPIAMFILLLIAGVDFTALFGLSIRRFRSSIPLTSHCSAAISAACHPPADDVDAAVKAVMWGEMASETDYPHCTFTSQPVVSPSIGCLYI
ncbi:hypothetical protein ASPZODRAFT_66871 [Penicilliopsis zonata CBS 506.65]|uniref:DUF6536 domain-containing protein n=1 Tax=Penicilliopsis zonata CBS 506.65 TaxID=1073090 RepID=A0A1L9SI30_9EURO|nr:hypothetical protein ASPZODRAFT_66871 [Penicilliopsis zonata CBS 506.65]OJJ46763.1 hypothetical protein ASPZODRAFT_66871 [Penicilliopsis zonata CBS 506.65]